MKASLVILALFTAVTTFATEIEVLTLPGEARGESVRKLTVPKAEDITSDLLFRRPRTPEEKCKAKFNGACPANFAPQICSIEVKKKTEGSKLLKFETETKSAKGSNKCHAIHSLRMMACEIYKSGDIVSELKPSCKSNLLKGSMDDFIQLLSDKN